MIGSSLSALFAMLVLLVFVVSPLTSGGVFGTEVSTTFFSLLAVTGVAAVSRRPLIVALLMATALASIGLDWIAHFGGGSDTRLANLGLRGAFIVLLAGVVIFQVFRPVSVTHHRVQGAVVVYLLAGLAWAHFFAVHHLIDPAAIKLSVEPVRGTGGLGLFQYFSFETLTTLGYGDILPVSPLARALASGEALFGQLYPPLMIARLVTLELHERSR